MSSLKKISKLLESGLAYHQAGLLEQAETAYRSVLQKKPKNPDALNLLGVIAHQTGRNEIAVKLIKKAIIQNPNITDFYNNCGEAYRALGEHNSAVEYYEKAILLQPNNADAYNNLGLSFTNLSSFDKAISCFERALTFNPNDPEIHTNMGCALSKRGQFNDAINSYKKAINLKPDFIDAYISLGVILNKLRQHKDAIDLFKKALTIDNNNALLHYNLADTLYESNQIQEAINYFKLSLTFDPNNAFIHNRLGLAFNTTGEFENASKHYEQALALKPNYVDPLYNLVIIEPKQEYISLIKEHLNNPETSENDKIAYHYALGVIFEKSMSYDETFNHYSIANSLKRKTISYQPENTSAYIDKLLKVYSKDYFQKKSLELGSNSELPVFIIGMPRSGTTLVEHIISSHPQIYGAGELEMIRFIEKIITKHFTQINSYPECITLCDQSTLSTYTAMYIEELKSLSSDSIRITDKMPSNFLRVGLIKTLFPKARVIHCRRSAMDVCLSIYLNYFVHGNKYSFELTEIGKYYLDYERLMKHWLELFPSDIFEVQYEELVKDQENNSKRLIEFLGLGWDEQCNKFHENIRQVKTASNTQVRQPIYTNSISRWKNYEKHLEPLKEILKDYI
jgi:tetratricopeptide (TPR) repeat protein